MPNWDYFLDVLCWGHNFLSLSLDLSKFLLLLPCVILCRSEILCVCVCVCVCARVRAHLYLHAGDGGK